MRFTKLRKPRYAKLNKSISEFFSEKEIQQVGATGGVHKGQGRTQHELLTRAH